MEKWNELEWWKRTVRALVKDIEEEIATRRELLFLEIEEDLSYYKEKLEELEENTPAKITKVRSMATYLHGLYTGITGDDDDD